MLRRCALGAATALALAVAPAADAARITTPVDLANACVALPGHAEPIHVEPTRHGRYLLLDAAGRMLRGGDWVAVDPADAGPAEEVAIRPAGDGRFRVAGLGAVTIAAARGCAAFPEAELGVRGRSAEPLRADGTVYGYADTHLHVTADLRAGGQVISGRAFHPFGIARALGGDADVHGADGGLDVTGNLLREGVPFGTHDTQGWPTFSGWPTHDTNTHQQVYWRWLERTWRSGLRLIVAHTVEDAQICHLQPRTSTPCDETAAARGQIERLRQLQAHIDAQHGGPGRGWLRIVTSPAQARRVIARGKLAVVIGLESSFPLGCRAEGADRCTTKDVDRRLDALYDLGVRSLFLAHWADNGFAGAGLQGGVKGKFINAMHRLETGRWFDVEACPAGVRGEVVEALSDLELDVVSQFFPAAEPLKAADRPAYPASEQCNPRGLTTLGEHLVRRMAQKGMLIEADHLSHAAREDLLDLAERLDYPLVSGHNGTGGAWTDEQLERLHRLGGLASQTPESALETARQTVARKRHRAKGRFFAVGLGTDTGGFAALPGPREDAASDPLPYPFRLDGQPARFDRQRTGERVFDLNRDGVAHYGLVPDWLADVERRPGGREAIDLLFRSAEAYLRMWERAVRR